MENSVHPIKNTLRGIRSGFDFVGNCVYLAKKVFLFMF
ncbi:MAG: hypothetical protein ACI828_000107 [Flavobacteriales bacterium]|jgi:hypothetical protein